MTRNPELLRIDRGLEKGLLKMERGGSHGRMSKVYSTCEQFIAERRSLARRDLQTGKYAEALRNYIHFR